MWVLDANLSRRVPRGTDRVLVEIPMTHFRGMSFVVGRPTRLIDFPSFRPRPKAIMVIPIYQENEIAQYRKITEPTTAISPSH